MSAFCQQCGDAVTERNKARGHRGPASWCVRCPPAEEYRWESLTVSSRTNWQGGRVTKAPTLDDVEGK